MPESGRRPTLEEARIRLSTRAVVSVYDLQVLTEQGEQAIRRGIADGTIPSVRLGRRVRVPSTYVRAMLGIAE